MQTILVLGGYGNFGRRITEDLCRLGDLIILIAGRHQHKAQDLTNRLQPQSRASLVPVQLDISSPDFSSELGRLSPDIVIHTGGPFQGQSYRVPEACLAIKAHYIDLADDRRFVCDIGRLDAQAKRQEVMIVAGASSVPGLSSAVIEHYRGEFSRIDSIDIAIAPGNRADRGEATVKAILSYTGHAFPVFSEGSWQTVYGWMDLRREDFGEGLGPRWLANVEVPDLELFPHAYQVRDSVRFQAGLELSLLHLGMVLMAKVAKLGLVKDWSKFTRPIFKCSEWFQGFGTDKGGMQVVMQGTDVQEEAKSLTWTLIAENGVGPNIPTISTLIVVKKILRGEMLKPGAYPCLGLYGLEDFAPYAKAWGLKVKEQFGG